MTTIQKISLASVLISLLALGITLFRFFFTPLYPFAVDPNDPLLKSSERDLEEKTIDRLPIPDHYRLEGFTAPSPEFISFPKSIYSPRFYGGYLDASQPLPPGVNNITAMVSLWTFKTSQEANAWATKNQYSGDALVAEKLVHISPTVVKFK